MFIELGVQLINHLSSEEKRNYVHIFFYIRQDAYSISNPPPKTLLHLKSYCNGICKTIVVVFFISVAVYKQISLSFYDKCKYDNKLTIVPT